jgi:cysteine desulfurase
VNARTPEEIIFTSGGAESANLAVKGVAWANAKRGKHLVVSAIEHPAILKSVEFLERQGFSSSRVPVDRQGLVHPEAVREALRDDTILVCVQHANHDVGAIQPIRQIAELTAERGIALFVDAVASAGWAAIDVQGMGIDLLALSAHRFYGPKGCGILYRNRRVPLVNLIHGGEQEGGRRAGTENVPAIAGGGVAAQMAASEIEARSSHAARLQRRLWEGIESSVRAVTLNGPVLGPQRLRTNLNVSAPFAEGEGQLLGLDMAGVAVASGATCASKAVKLSPVLQAMGLSPSLAESSLVFSLGKDTTDVEIEQAIAAYVKVVERLRSFSSGWEEFKGETVAGHGSHAP